MKIKTGQQKETNNGDNSSRSKTSITSSDLGIIDQNNNQHSVLMGDARCMTPLRSCSFPFDFGVEEELASPISSSTTLKSKTEAPALKKSSRSRTQHNQKSDDSKPKVQDQDLAAQNPEPKKKKKSSKEKLQTPLNPFDMELLLSKPPSPLKAPLTSTKESKALERKRDRESLHAKSIRRVLEWDYQPEEAKLQFTRSRPTSAIFGVPLATRLQVLPTKQQQIKESRAQLLKGHTSNSGTVPLELSSQSHVPFLRPTTPSYNGSSSNSNIILQPKLVPSDSSLQQRIGKFTFSKEKLLQAVKQRVSTPTMSPKASQPQFDTNKHIDYRNHISIPHTPLTFYTKTPDRLNPVYHNYWEACKKLCPELYEENNNKPTRNNTPGIPVEITRTIKSKNLEGKSSVVYRGGNAVVVNYIPSSERERELPPHETPKATDNLEPEKRTGTANVNSGLNQKIHELRKKINNLKTQKPKEDVALEKGLNQKRKFEQRLMDIELQRICLLTEKLDAEVAKSVLQAKKVQAKFAKANSEGTDKNNNNNGPGGTPVTVRTEANIIGPPPAVDKVEEEVTKKFKLMRPMSPYCSIQGTALSSQVEAKNQARQRRQAQLIEQYNQRMENLKNGKNESSQQTVWNSASVRARVDENKASSTSSITKAGLRLKVIYGSPVTKIPERTYGYPGHLHQRSMNQAIQNHNLYNSIRNAKSSYSRDSQLKDYKKHEAYATYGEEARSRSRLLTTTSGSGSGSFKRQVNSWVHN